MPKRSRLGKVMTDEHGRVIFDTTKFATQNEAKVYAQIENNSFAPERGLRLELPQLPYIDKYGWHEFVKTPPILADKALVKEFYANLGNYSNNHNVTVRGKVVNFSPKTINAMFKLKNYQKDGYTKLMEAPLDKQEVLKALTGGELDLPDNWLNIDRGDLTLTARLWYGFVLACLMPSTMNSIVQRRRALVTYALVSNRSIDVGVLINREIYLFLDPKELYKSLRFPVIITMLCRQAGVETDFQLGSYRSQSILCIKALEKENKPIQPPEHDGEGTSSQAAARTRAPPQDRLATLEAQMVQLHQQSQASIRHLEARMVQIHQQSQASIRQLEQANSQAIAQGFTAINQRLDTFFASFPSRPPGPDPSLP